ncbi:hypothetical protein Tsubulata_018832, partial [Turnera subulata]
LFCAFWGRFGSSNGFFWFGSFWGFNGGTEPCCVVLVCRRDCLSVSISCTFFLLLICCRIHLWTNRMVNLVSVNLFFFKLILNFEVVSKLTENLLVLNS